MHSSIDERLNIIQTEFWMYQSSSVIIIIKIDYQVSYMFSVKYMFLYIINFSWY